MLFQYGVDLNQIPDPQQEGYRAASLKTLLATVKDHSGAEIDHDEFARLSGEYLVENLQTRKVTANSDSIMPAAFGWAGRHGEIDFTPCYK